MSGQTIRAVIGKGFGDEGKGLAVDHFCRLAPDTLVIKHNGGAQAGHTVEPDGKRFVFHQLSSGSFRHCDTFWADSYYPDLYKLREEMEAFQTVSGFPVQVYCDAKTQATIIDDVLINMLLESLRGKNRHGSCGMGINECDLRTKAGFGVSVLDFLSKDAKTLTERMLEIRENYVKKRVWTALREMADGGVLLDLARDVQAQEYLECLQSKTVIENAVEEMQRSAEQFVKVVEDAGALLRGRESIVFETGQGLLLDGENKEFAPHVSASRTGLYHPVRICREHGLSLSEVVYVTRTYVTRHGAGPLPNECTRESLGITQEDATNVENPWQGSIRYARHGSLEKFLKPVLEDLRELGGEQVSTSLFLTHLNETDHRVMMRDWDPHATALCQADSFRQVFDRCYFSADRDAKETLVYELME